MLELVTNWMFNFIQCLYEIKQKKINIKTTVYKQILHYESYHADAVSYYYDPKQLQRLRTQRFYWDATLLFDNALEMISNDFEIIFMQCVFVQMSFHCFKCS